MTAPCVLALGIGPTFGQGAVLPIVVRTPDPHHVDLALDEIWLRGMAQTASRLPQLPNPDIRVLTTRGNHVVLAVGNTHTAEQLAANLRQLEEANAGTEAYLVLYERGAVHDDAHRSLLTREVAVLLQSGVRPPEDLAKLGAKPLEAVPGAFIVRAPDPLAALELADKLRAAPGVRTAYPLLKRQAFPR